MESSNKSIESIGGDQGRMVKCFQLYPGKFSVMLDKHEQNLRFMQYCEIRNSKRKGNLRHKRLNNNNTIKKLNDQRH